MARWSTSRFGGLYVFGGVLLGVSLSLRLALAVHARAEIDATAWSLVKTFAVGTALDLVVWLCLAAPVALAALVMPERLFRSRLNRWCTLGLYLVAVFALLFDAAAEWFFWDEFGVRFNFVAVDYLIYTQEVIGNIWESYPVVPVLGGLLAAAVAVVLLTRGPMLKALDARSTFRQRLPWGLAHLAAPVLALLAADLSWSNVTTNQYNNELAKNGIYSFVEAFRSNRIDYDRFYLTQPDAEAFARLRGLLGGAKAHFVTDDQRDITRRIDCPGPEKRHNVVLIVVESLSAEYLGAFGSRLGLTPNLDRLAAESLLFSNFYATGTRTDRGLEAIVLSLPPTPGQSVIKRPGVSGLPSIGTLFRQRGYDTEFLYGGFGYFDNMNAFFDAHGFTHVDRNDLSAGEVTFANAWGVCDGDLFRRAIRDADRSHAAGRPFMFLVLTTSNHRPYTYPQVIDIPSGTGRRGAVKYTDHAIGQFIREAATRPWFQDTMFIIVADHCANSAGQVEVPVRQYHIPLLIHAPKIVRPGVVDDLAGQMDLGPTLLGLLGFSYHSRFYGRDVLGRDPGHGRALLGNYQKLGLLVGDELALLLPKKQSRAYRIGGERQQSECPTNEELLRDAISYYQTAARLLEGRCPQPAPVASR